MRRRINPVLVLAMLAGCQTSDYVRSRVFDTFDMLPVSVGAGPWGYVGVRVTAFFGTGLGYAATERVGWCRRTADAPHDALEAQTQWDEEEFGLLIVWIRDDDPPPGSANAYFVLPLRGQPMARLFQPPLHNESFEWGSLLDLEAEVHLGIGVRAALSPVQVLDWLVGWFGLDLLGDDVTVPEPEVPAPDASGATTTGTNRSQSASVAQSRSSRNRITSGRSPGGTLHAPPLSLPSLACTDKS